MDTCLEKFNFGREIASWLKSLGHDQAMHVMTCIAKILKFAEENEEFFQGCGLYVVGSSLRGGNFNDIDLVLAGLDFRAVVSYDKIFLMDPETLIKERVLVEPQLFVVLDKNEEGKPKIMKPIMEMESNDLLTCALQFSHMGLEHNGKKYDYNFEEHAWLSLDLFGFCSSHARTSDFVKRLHEFLNPDDKFFKKLGRPFDRYGSATGPFLVYSVCIERKSDLPVAEGSIIEEVKPIDLSVHAENLQRRAWKELQSSLRLPYLTLKEWPETSKVRRTVTDLEYPVFIDPNGINRAEWNLMSLHTYCPEEPPEVIVT